MDKMREEFEAWFCSTIPYQIAKSSWFAIMDDGDYIITDVQASWAGWKASRAALCVELPKTPDFSASDEPDLAFEWGVDVMKDLIESAGVTCK